MTLNRTFDISRRPRRPLAGLRTLATAIWALACLCLLLGAPARDDPGHGLRRLLANSASPQWSLIYAHAARIEDWASGAGEGGLREAGLEGQGTDKDAASSSSSWSAPKKEKRTLFGPTSNNQRIKRRGLCVRNAVTGTTLCDTVASGSTSLDIGSANGQWALLWSDGNPRIVSSSRIVLWASKIKLPPNPQPCGKYGMRFWENGTVALLSCGNVPLASMRVVSGTLAAKRITIENSGVVRFYSQSGQEIMRIDGAGTTPPSALAVSLPATSTTRPTSTLISTTSKTRTTTPTTSLSTSKSRTATTTSQSRTATTSSQSRTRTTSETTTRTLSSTSLSRTSTTKTTSSVTTTLTSTTSESATSTSSATRTQTLSSTTRITRTPALHPANTLSTSCTYIPVPYTVASNAQTQSDVFNIELVNCGSDPSAVPTFVRAAQRWMSVITGDLGAYNWGSVWGWQYNLPMSDFDGNGMGSIGYIDDLLIGFSVKYIDGPYNVLGAAGPDYYRSWSTKQPLMGFMEFDSADWTLMQTKGILEAVVLHEMGHVLGLGSMWTYFGLLSPSNCYSVTGVKPAFLGSSALGTLQKDIDPRNSLGVTYVPVEDTGGGGTRCSHWQESSFRNELMTGWVSYSANPLSTVTAYSMEDMGYTINKNSSGIDRNYRISQPYRKRGDSGAVSAVGDSNTGTDMGNCLDRWRRRPAPLPDAFKGKDGLPNNNGKPVAGDGPPIMDPRVPRT